jgi:hypothetical protein
MTVAQIASYLDPSAEERIAQWLRHFREARVESASRWDYLYRPPEPSRQ